MKKLLMLFISIFFVTAAWASDAAISDLEDLNLAPDSYWNGPDLQGEPEKESTFTSGIAAYNNLFGHDDILDYDYWAGFAYSSIKDTTTSGLDGQYIAIPGSGAKSSDTYAVGYYNTFKSFQPIITLAEPQTLSGAYFTNNNYAYYSMTNGDVFAKKFTDDDWFKLTITGIDAEGAETGTVEFKLADGTNIVNTWTWVDLSGLGVVKKLTFDLSSRDNDVAVGMNTPAYFCMDNFNEDDSDENDIHHSDGGCFINSIKSEFLSR